MGIGVGAETVERTEAGRTEAGALDRTTFGAGGTTVVETGTGGGTETECITASSFTTTGVPTGAFSKNVSAIPCGTRIQPWDAAYGGT
jgi:hypothetical protein